VIDCNCSMRSMGWSKVLFSLLSRCFWLAFLSHFGSDTTGVNATRRYLCEALSFQYRYIPIGILEQLPGRINDRAPAFRGRNELGKSFLFPRLKIFSE
jgi:hypothetical protein